MDVSKVLGQSSFWMINKLIAEEHGLKGALLLSILFDGRESCGTDSDGWFYQTTSTMETFSGIKDDTQAKILKGLEKSNFLEIKYAGMPRKRYIKINDNVIMDFLWSKKSESSTRKNRSQAPEKIGTNKDNNNKNYNNKNYNNNLITNNISGETPEPPCSETEIQSVDSFLESRDKAGIQEPVLSLPKETPPVASAPPKGWNYKFTPQEALDTYQSAIKSATGKNYTLDASTVNIKSIKGILQKLSESGAVNSIEVLKEVAKRSSLHYLQMGESMSKKGINAGGVFMNIGRLGTHLSKFDEIKNASELSNSNSGRPDGANIDDDYIQQEIERLSQGEE